MNQNLYIATLLRNIGVIQHGKSDEESFSAFLNQELSKIPVLRSEIEEIFRQGRQPIVSDALRTLGENPEKPFLALPLSPVFERIGLKGNSTLTQKNNWFYPVGVASIDSNPNSGCVFPQKQKPEDFKGDLRALWEDFVQEHRKLSGSCSIQAYSTGLYALIAKFGVRVGIGQSGENAEVSFFDHTRSFAGLVNCLGSSVGGKDEFVFLLGDLSGLQKFIYSQIDPSAAGDGKGLAKRLRGRSYYIALLTDVIAERLTETFGVNEANILYAGGGGFQLLLPKTGNFQERIEAFTKEINQFLFEKIGGRIGLITGYAEADQTIFQQSSRFIQQAYDHIGEEKARKFRGNLDYLFFERPKQGESKFKEDEWLGEKIPYGKLILEVEANGLRIKRDELKPEASLEALDRYFFILDERKARSDIEADAKRIIEAYRDQARSFRLLSINDTDFLSDPAAIMKQLPDVDIRAGFRFIGSHAPTRNARGNDEVIMFEQLAKKNYMDEKGELSYPKLAVMRLDVDNLGALFAMGLGEQASFARVATLSRELHLFFSGYFNKLAAKYSLYVTYSGGDDAFVVGSWLNVMHAAGELYDNFKRFTCDNPELSFSAGIFMCSEYYPVVKFARKAEEAESKAKNFTSQGQEKNAICVFDHALSWTQYKEMLQFAQTILKYVEHASESDRNKLSRSLIHRIHQIVKSCFKEDGSIHLPRLYQQTARLHYLFARQTVVADGFTYQFMEKTATKATAGGSLNYGEQIAQHIIRVFLDYFTKPGYDQDGKNGILGNLIIPTSYVTYKTRTTEK
jgi:CRISPR-associated protein Csm1